jgi:hypothetical protein
VEESLYDLAGAAAYLGITTRKLKDLCRDKRITYCCSEPYFLNIAKSRNVSDMDSADKTHRQPERSKNAARVDRQLEDLNAASAEGANVTDVASTTEETVKDATEAGDTTKPQTDSTRGQLGKAKRAFSKAGQPDASEEVRKEWLAEMSAAKVAVMDFTSSRLAKVIKGELTISELQK